MTQHEACHESPRHEGECGGSLSTCSLKRGSPPSLPRRGAGGGWGRLPGPLCRGTGPDPRPRGLGVP